MKGKLLFVLVLSLVIFLVILLVEIIYIKYNGTPVVAPTINRQISTLGKGSKIKFLVMGDSTAVSQGSSYEDGYAVAATNHLAKNYEVSFLNLAISGATTGSVISDQLKTAANFQPDLVLLAVGANDATHFVKASSIQLNLQKIIDSLKKSNSKVRIIVTGSPAMDSLSRFPLGAKQIMGLRTRQVNNAFKPIIEKNGLIKAPIAQRTRQAFLNDTSLTASDKFHPSARGYDLWKPVINEAIDQALKSSPIE